MEDCVSIIIPIFKAERYIDECIRSVTRQTYKSLEIILVNDGSPDNCPQICDEWAAKDDRIKVIHKNNTGLSDSRNVGILNANGKWIIFVDADDVVSERLIEVLINNEKDAHLVTCHFKRFNDVVEECSIKDSIDIEIYKNTDLGNIRGGLYVWGNLYNSEIIKQHSILFDETLSNLEDVVWNAVYCRYIKNIIFVNQDLYFYRRTPDSITSNCVNREWQILSWLSAKESIIRQYDLRKCEKINTGEFKREIRRCNNNIYEECLAGSIDYKTLWNLKRGYKSEKDLGLLFRFEYILERMFKGLIYYSLYIMALKVRHKMN